MLILLLGVVACAYGQDLELVWSDEFDGAEIDPTKWEHEVTAWGAGNGEFQLYANMPENSWVQDGLLNLKPTFLEDNINPQTGEPFGADYLDNGDLDLTDMFGYCSVPDNDGCRRTGRNDNSVQGIPPMASARLRTAGRFSYMFGRAEIYAKMPVGDWLWPAMWLLPENWVYGDGGWPASGEIDIMEAIGNRDFKCEAGTPNEYYRDIQHVSSALHWGVDWQQNRYYLTTEGIDNVDRNYGDYFHLYRLDWTPQGFEMSVDDTTVLRVPEPPVMDRDASNCWTGFYDFGGPWNDPNYNPWTPEETCVNLMAPFDQDFHFIFNIAIGGTNYYIPEGCTNRGGDPEHQKPWANGGGQEPAMWDFYDAQDSWYQTWMEEGDNLNMQIDWIRVYQASEYGNTEVPEGCAAPPAQAKCPE